MKKVLSQMPAITPDEDIARRTLEKASMALEGLSKGVLPKEVASGAHLMHHCSGKIITSGVGKSSFVARKLASSLASIGAPAFFLDATDAAHGDLGVLGEEDLLILFSKSGESTELFPMLHYAQQKKVAVIAVTMVPDSTLGQRAHITLALPTLQESCPLGVAPTTSTLMMLALSDALLNTLMCLNNVTHDQYKANHPGGMIGYSLLTVGDVMRTQDLPFCTPEMRMQEGLLEMTRGGLGCLGVVAPGTRNLVGLITDGDLRRHLNEHFLTCTAAEVMTKDPWVLTPEISLQKAAQKLNARKVQVAFVVNDQGAVLGLVHLHDCLYQHFLNAPTRETS